MYNLHYPRNDNVGFSQFLFSKRISWIISYERTIRSDILFPSSFACRFIAKLVAVYTDSRVALFHLILWECYLRGLDQKAPVAVSTPVLFSTRSIFKVCSYTSVYEIQVVFELLILVMHNITLLATINLL